MKEKKVVSDYVIIISMVVIMVVVFVTTLYPFLNSLAISFNHADDTILGGITIYPRVPTIANYRQIFTNPTIWKAYGITFARTIIGAAGGLVVTGAMAFGLSRKNLVFRKFYTFFCLIPMYFGGGLIPTYFLIQTLGLRNNFLVYIIPNLVNIWNMILMRSYFQSVPDALEESSRIDGANYITIFFKIYWPVSTPIIATIALYFGVYHWNDWFMPNIYITNTDLKPMTSVLLSIISEAAFAERMAAAGAGAFVGDASKGKQTNVRSITMATMITSIVPIVAIYPFLQRYFLKGIMVGSIKG
ncbi:carbohydrate ABC transporter permease [Acutalibacter sp. 1XD8-36]|uniref:carbohydrate ABC transporter permease n=1 Tax=Acutalibacter sp. 1XD8-36 TaxID=2320852 RepID=UPI00260CB488|nr:carbohydrate ABC transporter permease [Acutalibacter sp. 1XD8-36]